MAVVIDLICLRVVGWSLGSRMKAKLVCDVVTMAIWQHKTPEGLLVHSDMEPNMPASLNADYPTDTALWAV
ncbi:hypothetical protein [Alteromonas sp. MB-3u-76]|uniref:hypothetical protein n=1 Tax=Alteromonas sp. MB-3u-76 TaxID=2058133 RepID=UPI0012FE29E4